MNNIDYSDEITAAQQVVERINSLYVDDRHFLVLAIVGFYDLVMVFNEILALLIDIKNVLFDTELSEMCDDFMDIYDTIDPELLDYAGEMQTILSSALTKCATSINIENKNG